MFNQRGVLKQEKCTWTHWKYAQDITFVFGMKDLNNTEKWERRLDFWTKEIDTGLCTI